MIFENRKICFFIIFVGFCLSVFSSINNTIKNDYFFLNQDNQKTHNIIKGDIDHYWSEADIIKKNIDISNSISGMSRPLFRNYFYPKFIASYYLIINKDIKDINGEHKIDNYKIGIPIIQSIIFFLCLIYFFIKVKKKFNNFQITLIVLFLSLNPIISQYHSSYWTESLFLSMLLLLFANLIELPKNNFKFIIIGVLVGFIYLQRSPALFLCIPIIIYFFFVFKSIAIKKSLLFISGFVSILFLIGFENYKRSKIFYVTTLAQSNAHFHYVSHKLNAKKMLISEQKSFHIKNKDRQKFIDDNKLNIKEEKDLIKIANFEKKYFLNSLKGNLIFYCKYHLYKTMQALTINKDAVYFNWENKNKFWKTKRFKEKFKKDLLVSFFFYLICLMGLIQLYTYKNKNFNNIIIFTSLFLLYNIIILGWMGIPRYMIGNQVLFSIFFSFGIEKIYNYFTKIKS